MLKVIQISFPLQRAEVHLYALRHIRSRSEILLIIFSSVRVREAKPFEVGIPGGIIAQISRKILLNCLMKKARKVGFNLPTAFLSRHEFHLVRFGFSNTKNLSQIIATRNIRLINPSPTSESTRNDRRSTVRSQGVVTRNVKVDDTNFKRIRYFFRNSVYQFKISYSSYSSYNSYSASFPLSVIAMG